jgi:hypothetical protein
MKDFVLNSFHFGLVEKGVDRFLFKLVSDHDNLRTERNERGEIIALIDGDVLLKNHIIKHTRNDYVYFVSDIALEKVAITIQMLRKKFDHDKIVKSLASQRLALDSYKKKELKLDNEKKAEANPLRRRAIPAIVEQEQARPARATATFNPNTTCNFPVTGMANAPFEFRQEYQAVPPAIPVPLRFESVIGRSNAQEIELYGSRLADNSLNVEARIEAGHDLLDMIEDVSGSFTTDNDRNGTLFRELLILRDETNRLTGSLVLARRQVIDQRQPSQYRAYPTRVNWDELNDLEISEPAIQFEELARAFAAVNTSNTTMVTQPAPTQEEPAF